MPDRKEDPAVVAWIGEIQQAEKREKDFRKEAKDIVKIYEGGESARDQFNILYANTETLAPALYNSTPRPLVKRRFNEADPLAKAASQVVQRTLAYTLDDNLAEFPTFDSLIESAVLQALVPGRGLIRYDYEAKFEEVPEVSEPASSEEAAETPEPKTPAEQRVASEAVAGTFVPWDRFAHGYGKTWEDVPWIGYQLFMTQEEIKKTFPDTYQLLEAKEISVTDDRYNSLEDSLKGVKLVEVWQIWDKSSLMVYHVAKTLPEQFLKAPEPDPYGLSGFFNCAKPLMLFNTISELQPVPLYRMYKKQAEELNNVTVRIGKLVQALKVRGFYDSTISGIEKIFEADDNTLLPMDNAAAMYGTSGAGLDKALLLIPIEKLVTVLQQLLTHRQQVKQVIYEITGIADIMRGVSQASETLGAQELKNQWGTLRLKRFQRRVALFVRHNLRLIAELSVTKLAPETLGQMTGLNFPTGEQKQQAQVLVQTLQMQGQQPDPQALEILQKPSWDELLQLLQNDIQRSFRIDIEANSTLDAEATEDKQDIQELLGAISQFFAAIGPQVESGVLPFDVAKGMLIALSRRYRLGADFEEELGKMQAPQPKADPKDALAKLEMQAKQEEMQHEKQMREMDMQFRQAEHQMNLQELQQKGQLAQQSHVIKLREMQAQAAMPPKPPKTPR